MLEENSAQNEPFDGLEVRLFNFLYSSKERREYLGCSILGHPCDRYLWYNWKGVEPPPPSLHTHDEINKLTKQQIRFEIGHVLEDHLIHLMNKIGYLIIDKQKSVSLLDGAIKGHIDGVIFDTHRNKYVLEIKTMNDQRYKTLVKKKVKNGFPEYWSQCQAYMKGLEIEQTLFIALNKNTGELYKEIIYYNSQDADGLLLKAQRIFQYETEPSVYNEIVGRKPMVCHGCDFFWHCYGG